MNRGYGPDNTVFFDRAHHGGPSALAWTLFALLLALLLIALVSLVLDAYYRSQRPGGGSLAVLDERYARGEIARDAYLQARADLGGKVPSEATTEVTPPTRRRRTPPAPAS